MTAYRIEIEEELTVDWSSWFEGWSIEVSEKNGHTILDGQARDQTELHGILNRIRDMGLTLISVLPQINEEE